MMAKLTPEEIDRRVEEIARRCKYEGYLMSRRWAEKRRAKLVEANYTCQNCGHNALTDPIGIPVDVHHLTYERLGEELPGDLKVLCRNCHDKVHNTAPAAQGRG